MRRQWRLCLLALSFVLGVTPKALAEEGEDWSFTSIDFPDAAGTNVYDINAAGDSVGRYCTPLPCLMAPGARGNEHGYLRTRNGDFTPIDVPGSDLSAALGINSHGDIVGPYRLASDPLNSRHGFLLSNSQLKTFDFPGAFFTQPVGINDHGDIVGRYCTVRPCALPGSSNLHGFLLHEGEFISIDSPEAVQSSAWKINRRGQIIGGYVDADGKSHVYLLSEGEFTTIDFPGAFQTGVATGNGGISPRGDIVSFYCDDLPCNFAHGFLRTRKGEFTTIDFPGATATLAFGINRHDDIVGSYLDVSGNLHGFLLSREERDDDNDRGD